MVMDSDGDNPVVVLQGHGVSEELVASLWSHQQHQHHVESDTTETTFRMDG